METNRPLLQEPKGCVCCGASAATAHRRPLCDACVSPDEIRSYCAKCGARGAYVPEDFIRVMSTHYPEVAFERGMVVRLPACATCNGDGRPPVGDGRVRFLGIAFD